jgi:hypothetical protein
MTDNTTGNITDSLVICSSCKKLKLRSEVCVSWRYKGKERYRCKSCSRIKHRKYLSGLSNEAKEKLLQYHREYNRKYKRDPKNKDKLREYDRQYKRKYAKEHKRYNQKRNLRRYGLTIKEYDEILELQGGVCFLCKKPPNRKKLAVDHNHSTGERRMLLCSACNLTVGVVESSPDYISRLLDYINN